MGVPTPYQMGHSYRIYVDQNRPFASVVEMVDTSDLKSDGCIAMPVQVRPEALLHNEHNSVVGVKASAIAGRPYMVSRVEAVSELVTQVG